MLALLQAQEASQRQQQQRLVAAIGQSMEFARAADQLTALQARAEALTQQLLHAGRARDAAETALLEQSQRMHDMERRLKEQHEVCVRGGGRGPTAQALDCAHPKSL